MTCSCLSRQWCPKRIVCIGDIKIKTEDGGELMLKDFIYIQFHFENLMVKFFEVVDSYKLAMKDKKEKKLVMNGSR